MDELIPVMNELQSIFRECSTEIKLPEVVVVGSQSSGKSSVLESLVGKSFLPKGTGMVTRCPIILQLIQTKGSDQEEWTFSFHHEPNKLYTDEEEVRKVIMDRTNELTENNEPITRDPIFVTVHSTNVIPLTVVDLPGIVKLKMGDQPENIEEIVKELILEKIRNPNAIILAVSPANADIATSDSIKLAQEVDPEQKRTLAVITKLDLMDKGTDAKKLLAGEIIKMKQGIIGVVNRSQHDIENNVSIKDALEKEKKFLSQKYPSLKKRIGTAFLAEKLNQLLKLHIRDCLPALKDRVSKLVDKHDKILAGLGPKIADCDKRTEMEEVINKFIEEFKVAYMEGAIAIQIYNKNVDTSKKIRCFGIDAEKNLQIKIQQAYIKTANVEGFKSIEKTFNMVAKEKVCELKPLCVDGTKAAHQNLLAVVDQALRTFGNKWPSLNAKISAVAKQVLDEQLKITIDSIEKHVEIQSCIYFTLDRTLKKMFDLKLNSKNAEIDQNNNNESLESVGEDEEEIAENGHTIAAAAGGGGRSFLASSSAEAYGGGSSAALMNYALMPIATFKRNQDAEGYIRRLIVAYCTIIRKSLADYLPKHNCMYLFHESLELMKKAVRNEVAGCEDKLISEPMSVQELRSDTEEMLTRLTQARNIIDKNYFLLDSAL